MPSFLHLGDQEVTNIYKFLSSLPSSGGAPLAVAPQQNRNAVRDYPEGVARPKDRYTDGSTTAYRLGYPNLIGPPWSSIVAYGLNTGKIKWKRALGNDDKLGGKDSGLPAGSPHKGRSRICT